MNILGTWDWRSSRDYFSWVVADEIKNDFLWGIHDVLLKEPLSFDYSKLDTDVFREIYQNIIEHDERAALESLYARFRG